MLVKIIYAFLLLVISNKGFSWAYPTQGQHLNLPSVDMSNSYYLNDANYIVSTYKVPWFKAYVLCKQLHGKELATITTPEEQKALEHFLRFSKLKISSSESFWIGGTRHGACGSDFVWLSTGIPVVYGKFAPNQPDSPDNWENCLEMVLNNDDSFVWNDAKCDKEASFICQSPQQTKHNMLL